MRPAHIAVLAVLLGCSDKPTVTPDASVDGNGQRTVSGRDVVRNVINTATRTPVIVEDIPIRSLVVNQLLPDRTSVPVAVAPDGTFSFTAEGPWRAEVITDGGIPTEYQLSTDKLDLSLRVVGRYDRPAVPANTTLSVSVSGAPGGGTALIASTGLWTQSYRSGGSNGSFTIDWSNSAGTLSGDASLLDAAQYDRVFYATIEGTGSPQYQALSSSCTSDVTMIGGGATQITCGATQIVADRCLHLVAPQGAETLRLTTATADGPAQPSYQAYWITQALPAPTLGPIAGLWIAYDIPGAGTTQPADIDRDINFGNPYPGHDIAVLMAATKSRTFSLGAAAPTTLGATTVHYVRAQPDCTTPTEIPQVVAIPSFASIDGIRLTSDAMTITLDRTRLHRITFDIAAEGDADYYSVRIIEISISTDNKTTLSIRRVYVTTEREVVLDPAMLEVGRTYVIETNAVIGNPDAKSGDFRNWSFPATPQAGASVMSAAFRVDG